MYLFIYFALEQGARTFLTTPRRYQVKRESAHAQKLLGVPDEVESLVLMSLALLKMAESEEEVDVLVQRVVKDITNAFKRNPDMYVSLVSSLLVGF